MESYAEQGAGADSIEQIGFGGARRTKKKHRGLTVFQLKVIGAVALALSAGSTTIVPLFFGSDVNNMTSLTAMVLSEVISWFAIPIYAWLLVQGFRETHSRVAYGLQLFILAVVCEVPYDLATSHKAFDLGSQNPVFGLFVCVCCACRARLGGVALSEGHEGAVVGRTGGDWSAVGPAAAYRPTPAHDEHRFGDAWLRADFRSDAPV